MSKTVRKLICASILLAGTQAITLPFVGLSLFQIVLLITVPLAIVNMFTSRFIPAKKNYLFAIAFFMSSIIAWFVSVNRSWANSYLLLGLMVSVLVAIIPYYFKRKDIQTLERAIIRSQYIVFPLSIYSYYMFYFKGGVPNHIPLFFGMSINLSSEEILRAQAANQIRLALPYATPPILSIAVSICIVILVVDKEIFKRNIRLTLISSFLVVLVFTGSRSGIVGLLIFAILYLLMEFNRRIKAVPLVISFLVLLSVAIIVVPNLSTGSYVYRLINRFLGIKLSSLIEDRHFLVPLDGVIIWFSSAKNFLIGIGFGSSATMTGAHTYLPPYFLNSFVTLVAERGLLGLVIDIMMISLAFRLIKQRKSFAMPEKGFLWAFVTGLIGCFFYEGLNCYLFLFILAGAFAIDANIANAGGE